MNTLGIPTSDLQKQLLDHLTTAVVLLDDELKVQFANPAAEQFMGASRNQLQGVCISVLLQDPEDATLEDLRNAVRDLHPLTKREAQIQLTHQRQATTVDYTITPIVSLNAKAPSARTPINRTMALLLEIRPLDRLMRISREDAIINTHVATRALVRGVAHEVKNPLGGIRGAAQLLARELPDSDMREYTDIIIAEVDRLRNLVDQMMGPRKLPKPALCNIHEVLERVRSVLKAETAGEVQLQRDYDPSLPDLWADKDQLIQAILNIVRNAYQALLENESQVSPPLIKLRTRALRQFTIGHTRHRLVLLVEIEDNGPGVSKEMQETMFYPMVSGRANGSGLGLSISQSIINQQHGLIECQSEPGKTLFRLLLPLEPLPASNETTPGV